MLHMAFNVVHPAANLVPKVISTFTRSAVYHCELMFNDGTTVTSIPKGGVSFHERRFDRYRWIFLPLPWINYLESQEILEEAKGLVGAKYDWAGALIGGIWSSAQNPHKWFCSELCAHLLRPYTPPLQIGSWISPDELWRLCSEYLSEQRPEYDEMWKFRYHAK